jgi:ATP-dependent Clp endopeptidase proteolytic subunit ClpP|tara:strand:- start:682 stop:1659 length:978 start_codon:yes stop_codon:yes gene_type:complete
MKWYNIKNISTDTTEVVIYDEIGAWGMDSKTFIDEIKNISTDNVTLRINSPGGSVIDGLSIHDAIKRMPQKVTARIEGLAASIATIIALGADEVSMSENSLFMIHNVWGGETGGAEDMRKAADLMEKMGGRLLNIYAKKTGKSEDEIRAWMDAETWFTSDEALEAGFINTIDSPIALAAKFDINKLNYKNKTLVVDMFNSNKINKKMENQIEELKNFISELFNKKNVKEVNEVKILDNEEVVAKISALEGSITDSNKNVSDLTEALGEKESNIIALNEEVKSLEEKVAKLNGTPSSIVPEGDPNPEMMEEVEDVWSNLAVNIYNS